MPSHLDWTFGASTLHRIIESEGPLLDPFEVFADCTKEHLEANREWLVPRFHDPESGLLVISIQSFLIRHNGLNILVDACAGNDKERVRQQFHQQNRPWLDVLRAAGVGPEDIDIVLCTHLHVDHVGWNTRLDNGKWVPTFPKARYLIARREFEFWNGPGAGMTKRSGDYMADSVLPVFATGQADLVADEHAIASGIAIEPAHGHTPGQMQVRIDAGPRQAVLCSDLMHHPLQIRYPDWSTRFCIDPDQARVTRQAFLKEHANTGRLIFPAHFPTPTGCTIHRDGEDYSFTYDGEGR